MLKSHRAGVFLAGLRVLLVAPCLAEPWPGWRGPHGDGSCAEKGIPTDWSPARATWKTKLPGQGHASPIVWGHRVVTVTGVTDTQERILLCVDRDTGGLLWQETVIKGPLQKLHRENSHASPAIRDGQVFIRGFEHLLCVGGP